MYRCSLAEHVIGQRRGAQSSQGFGLDSGVAADSAASAFAGDVSLRDECGGGAVEAPTFEPGPFAGGAHASPGAVCSLFAHSGAADCDIGAEVALDWPRAETPLSVVSITVSRSRLSADACREGVWLHAPTSTAPATATVQESSFRSLWAACSCGQDARIRRS